VHNKGQHGYTGIWGGNGASFHHNLLANSYSRNPRFCGSRYSNRADLELVDFRNNVIYNWGGNSGYAGEGGRYNLINNYYKAGPGSNSGVRDRIFQPYADDGTNSQAAGIWGMFYVNGNYMHNYPNITADNWIGIDPNPSTKSKSELKSSTEFSVDSVATQAAEVAFEHVLAQAGAVLPNRDTLDVRIIREVISGIATYGDTYGKKKGIIDTQASVGGWPELKSDTVPADTDEDGMPDYWESTHSLNSNSSVDRNGDSDLDGYTNLEEYLNELAVISYVVRPLHFTATSENDSLVSLTWDDISENEAGFMIERSTGEKFEVIGNVPSNTSEYQDILSGYGKFTYRLRAFNETDTSFYTDTVSVFRESPVNSLRVIEDEVMVYPNPAGNEINIQTGCYGSPSCIEIYSGSGAICYRNPMNSKRSEGFSINTQNLSTGLYCLIIYFDETTRSVRFVKE
jgi:hypothetical protein